MLCDDLDGWDASGGGREVQEQGDICADSHYTAETNTDCKAIMSQLKIIKRKEWISSPRRTICKERVHRSTRDLTEKIKSRKATETWRRINHRV